MELESDLFDEVKRHDNRRAGLKRTEKQSIQYKASKVWTEFINFHDQATTEELNDEMFLQYFDFLINTKQYVR